MSKLLMLQGLPGCGKSTFARDLVSRQPTGEKWTIVNKDSIRRELKEKGWVWSQKNEADVLKIRDSMITAALSSGHDVISDDTNFGSKHQTRLEELAKQFGAEFIVKTFDTPVDECIRRDAARSEDVRVGEKVIIGMASKFMNYAPQAVAFQPVILDTSLMKGIICDLDGTLSLYDKGHRGPYEHEKCHEDEVNVPVRRLLEVYYRFMQYQIVYLSGREEKYRPQTEIFFRKNHCPPGPLWMRPTGDFRKDWIVKGELFDKYVRGKYNIEFVLDDRNQVVNFWRRIGLTCFQVAEGNF